MSDANETARLLIEDLWFVANESLHDTHIEWVSVRGQMDKIAPSTTEQLLVDLAQHIYTGRGTVDLATLFDHADDRTKALVLSALTNYLRGKS